MKVYIVDNLRYFNSQEKKALKKQVKVVLQNFDPPVNPEICITFLDDNEMRRLNKIYRGIKRTTDVLSFSQFTASDGFVNAAIVKNPTIHIGDIIISMETARKHAKLYRNSLKKEIQKLIIHGILHLLGYNHKKKDESTIMKKKEKKLLTLLNLIS
jgi:probable rRNA maturation factor